MWRTPIGDRRLDPAESMLFREAVASLVEELREERDILQPGEQEYQTGVAVFDDLVYPQRLLMLEAVTYALTANDNLVPEHSAVNEGAIAAVLAHLEAMIEIEIDLVENHPEPSKKDSLRGPRFVCGVDYPSMRQLLTDAVGDDECDEYGRPDPSSTDCEMWRAMVERAEERIFWDRDFEWHEYIVRTRALATLGVARGGEFECAVPAPDEISTASILRGFSRMRHELDEEWKGRRGSSGDKATSDAQGT
jgi:hypothetical protein